VIIIKDFWGIKSFRKSKSSMYSLGFKPQFRDTVPKFVPIPKRPNKNLTYAQGRGMFGNALSPFGNWDKDQHINMFDCRPFDPKRHKVPTEHKKRKVPGYLKPNRTWEDVWSEAEQDMPHAFKREQERQYSNWLANALTTREKTYKKVDTPFKDVVGIYKLDKVVLDRNQTLLAQQYVMEFLRCTQPDKHFEFYLEEPSKVKVTDLNTAEVREGVKVSRYFPKNTPPHIMNLLTLLTPYTNLTIVISDDPVDVMKKSSIVTQTDREGGWKLAWDSCETLGRSVIGKSEYGNEVGSFSDIKYGNAIAWFYLGKKQPGKDFPNGRVMLRWGTRTGEWEGDTDIGIEYTADSSNPAGFYGMSGRSARGMVGELQKILKSKG